MNDLMSAIYARQITTVRTAADSQPDLVLQRNSNGELPFEVAQSLGYVAIVATLLRRMPNDRVADEANLLVELVRELSDQFACAGWLAGIEFILWCLVSGVYLPVADDHGFSKLNREDLADLRFLSDRCQSWPIWDDHRGDVTLVSRAEWDELYKQWVAQHLSR